MAKSNEIGKVKEVNIDYDTTSITRDNSKKKPDFMKGEDLLK